MVAPMRLGGWSQSAEEDDVRWTEARDGWMERGTEGIRGMQSNFRAKQQILNRKVEGVAHCRSGGDRRLSDVHLDPPRPKWVRKFQLKYFVWRLQGALNYPFLAPFTIIVCSRLLFEVVVSPCTFRRIQIPTRAYIVAEEPTENSPTACTLFSKVWISMLTL